MDSRLVYVQVETSILGVEFDVGFELGVKIRFLSAGLYRDH